MTHQEAKQRGLETDAMFSVGFGYEMSEYFETAEEARAFFDACDGDYCDDATDVELFTPDGRCIASKHVCGIREHRENCEHR